MENKTLRLIVTGATGMVGEGVLHEALQRPEVEKVLIINRRPSGFSHPKVDELVVPDLMNLSAIEDKLAGFDGCLFCLGVSSVGMNEADYTKVTYDLTLNMARILVRLNPEMVFCYISGAGTDESEKGRMMWARVKGKTENDLQKLGFRAAYAFRPGILEPIPGLKNTLPYYKYVSWLFPVVRLLYPSGISTLSQLGQAMVESVLSGYDKPRIEVRDIRILSENLLKRM
ncbi:MAG TPA: NAD-dependent epimerase/dehydratase family protein [Catalimonadaceae bacterium]|nr:NAD-dependent epimerase/dehydratase family protein [Catalimonadaceae bacterium]